MSEFERSKARHPAQVHWERRNAALIAEGVTPAPKPSWWQRFRNRPKHATFRMMWRY